MKYKKKQTSFTLITYENNNIILEDDLRESAEIITLQYPSKASTILNTCLDTLTRKSVRFPITTFSLILKNKLEEIVRRERFDLVYFDYAMVFYVSKSMNNVPKVLDLADPKIYSQYQNYLNEKRLFKKAKSLLSYYDYRFFHAAQYTYFNAFIFVSDVHKKIMMPYIRTPCNAYCIPQGVDTESFKPLPVNEEPQSLIFTGTMSYYPNESAMLFFCKEIYPLIRQQMPHTKLYIVGRNPSKEILKMSSKDIKVTGFVHDVRPYLARASVALNPIISDDGGFKLKVLEAMAFAKPMVSTSLGVKGLGVKDGVNIILADRPKEFADKVVALLTDRALRKRIGTNARKLVLKKFSSEKLTNELNNVFKKIVTP